MTFTSADGHILLTVMMADSQQNQGASQHRDRGFMTHFRRGFIFGLILLIELAPPAESRPCFAQSATLRWAGGDSLQGQLIAADSDTLTWRSPLFVEPLQIRQDVLSGMEFPTAAGIAGVPMAAPGDEDNKREFRLLMRNGDVLFGELISITDRWIELSGSRFGTFSVARSDVMSLQRVHASAGIIYHGPRGLDGWIPALRRPAGRGMERPPEVRPGELGVRDDPAADDQTPEKRQAMGKIWSEQNDGAVSTTTADAALFLPQPVPDRFEIEVELSSTRTPSFSLVLGREPKTGVRLESWIDTLVVANDNSFLPLHSLNDSLKTVHLHLFVDQIQKRLAVYRHQGEKLGELEISGTRGSGNGVMLRNGEWDLTLKRLRISHWDGLPPIFATGAVTRIQTGDGRVIPGKLESLDVQRQTLRVLGESEAIELPRDTVDSIVFPAVDDQAEMERGATQVVWKDGGNVSGRIRAVADQTMILDTEYTAMPLRFSLDHVTRISMTPSADPPGQCDRLTHQAGTLHGHLVWNENSSEPVQWRPVGGINASAPVRTGDARFTRGDEVAAFGISTEWLSGFSDMIHLRNSDVLPCRIEHCSADQVTLVTPFASVRSFERKEIRAIELGVQGRGFQRGFGAPGWRGIGPPRSYSGNAPGTKTAEQAADQTESRSQSAPDSVTLRGNATVSHPSILTGDVIRFRLKWPVQSYASLTVSLFGDGTRKSTRSTNVTFSMMQSTLRVLDRAPPQEQMFFRGFGGVDAAEIIRTPGGTAEITLAVREGRLIVSVDGNQVKTMPLNARGAGSAGLAFHANVTMMGNVVINGRVQQSREDAVVISQFGIDSLAGASVQQFINEESRLAALTVPRFRRDNPPTHVLVAANGDLLRGHLAEVTDEAVWFESRLEKIRLERDRIAAIVWLRPPVTAAKDAAGNESAGNTSADTSEENAFELTDDADSFRSGMVQIQLSDGFRITMAPQRVDEGRLMGTSELLGECRVPVKFVRELIPGIDPSIEHVGSYDSWVVQAAREPDWDIAAASGGAAAGTEMIGTAAPDFELPMLDGKRFRLSEHADRIIVLDFWATWCGPCVAALPDYIAATGRFDKSQVIFLAVNQQESADVIRRFLSERQLTASIALDRGGDVGRQFQVSGIPHTVVIGRGGVIEDVHVGYQQGNGDSLQLAIRHLLDGTWKRPATISPQNP